MSNENDDMTKYTLDLLEESVKTLNMADKKINYKDIIYKIKMHNANRKSNNKKFKSGHQM